LALCPTGNRNDDEININTESAQVFGAVIVLGYKSVPTNISVEASV